METETIDDTSGQRWLRRRPRPALVYLGATAAVIAALAVAAPSGVSAEERSGAECEDVGPALDSAPAHPGTDGEDFVMVQPGTGASGTVDARWGDVPDGDEQVSTFIEVTCGAPMEGFELSPEDMDRMHEEMLAFDRCMRDQGVDLPDPEPGLEAPSPEVHVQDRGTLGMSDIDPRDTDFQSAEKECRPEGSVVTEGRVGGDPGASLAPHRARRAAVPASTEA